MREYLAVRGSGPTEHVFFYRNQALCKDLIHGRLKACGERVGVPVYPHRLRHTCATQLLNAGCRITSIQRFLGHKRLNTTLTYARAHDQTVAEDYFTAMSSVERRLELVDEPEEKEEPVSEGERAELLALAEQMVIPELCYQIRLEIAARMRTLLNGKEKRVESQDWVLERPPP
uniref:Tyr recombinase domain-containing protein n=1 Tax=Bellilinea caldifistulae TaxID=360411 RepID=A0A7C4KXF0_9CHLR